ncbi:MAG TPA: Sec-independent protein translocase protein TatB [Sphingobium sp.]|uniref:Sec-independent protein translocase protein TatB n=1 Tax=Sphingobium sp. TaxID=1912891 RepID=UPI002ED29A6E
MLDIGSSELLLIVIVAVVVIGPKDLPRVLYKLGQIIGKGRAMTRHFRSGIDEMIRQAEMEEMEKKWAADNARIMAQTQEAAPVAEAEAVTEASEASPAALPAPSASPVPEDAPALEVDAGPVPAHAPIHSDAAAKTANPDEAKSQGGSAA